jgi:hypothetical protein
VSIDELNQEYRGIIRSCLSIAALYGWLEVQGYIVCIGSADICGDTFDDGMIKGWVDNGYNYASIEIPLPDNYPSPLSGHYTVSVTFKSLGNTDDYYYDKTRILDNNTGDEVALNIDQFSCPWFRINQFVFYTHGSDDSQNGNSLEDFSIEPFGILAEDGGSYGSVADTVGNIGPNGIISFNGSSADSSYYFLIDCPGIYNDGDMVDFNALKNTFPEYDWDHPITKPYSEETPGLSATKKHFIRVS